MGGAYNHTVSFLAARDFLAACNYMDSDSFGLNQPDWRAFCLAKNERLNTVITAPLTGKDAACGKFPAVFPSQIHSLYIRTVSNAPADGAYFLLNSMAADESALTSLPEASHGPPP